VEKPNVGEVALFILGGLGCLLMMVAVMWLMNRAMTRRGRQSLKSAISGLSRVRREGIKAAIKGSIDAVASWAEEKRPDLHAAAAPDGTVTILFTDIEDSTALNERLGDQRWFEVLRAHNATVRKCVGSHGGYEVKAQGDGFMIAYPSARRALECAISMQRRLAVDGDGGLAEPLRVRIGLHTGEAIKEEGDFYGRSVTLAARIADEADGGEILASSLVRELAASGGDIPFEEAGEVRLKGLRGTQRIYRVPWEEPESARPRLRAAG
jgi:class 3 adenylate cyclase